MKRQSLTKKTGPYVYTLLILLVLAIFPFYPFFKTIYLSLYKTNKAGRAKLFVGLGNYVEPFTSKPFFSSLAAILAFMVIVVVGSMIPGLLSIILCDRSFLGIRVLSTVYVLPMVTASNFAAMIFRVILYPSISVVNKLLGPDINWVNDPKHVLVCVTLLTMWLNNGINFLCFSADPNNINESIYERVSVDGTGEMQRFLRLTLSSLSPVMLYTLVVNIIQAFQASGQVKILTKGGPGGSASLTVHSIYRDTFSNYRSGSAAAQSVILFVIIMVLTLMMFKVEKGGVNY